MTLKRLLGRFAAVGSQGRHGYARLWPVLLVWLLPCLGMLGTLGCLVEEPADREEVGSELEAPPAAVDEEGAFERLGERMDRGAEKLDQHLEVGTERIGRAMEKTGRNLQETAEEARQRRLREEATRPREPQVEVDIDVQR